MTIGSSTVTTSGSLTNGATVDFPFSFSVSAYGGESVGEQLEVKLVTISSGVETLLSYPGDFSATANGDQDSSPGGIVTTAQTYATGSKVYIRLNPLFEQHTSLQSQGAYNAETVEAQFDHMQRQISVLQDRVRRVARASIQATSAFDGEITGSLTPGGWPSLKSDLSGYQWTTNSGDATAVTATGSTTAHTLADRFAEVFNVKDYGATGDGSTDDHAAIQAAATACRLAGGGILRFPDADTYIVTEAIVVGSNTKVELCCSTVKAHQSAFVGTQANNNCYLFRNFTHTLTGGSLTDSDIVFEGPGTIDYGTVTIVGGGAHAISMSGVSRVTVRRVRFLEGGNGTAFRGCVDTLVDNCHALNQSNAFFDHWEGAGNCHVINCTGRVDTGTIGFGIMFTGTGSGLENLSTTDCLAAFNSLYGVRNGLGTACAINSNAQDADSSTFRFRSIGNYVEDSETGLNISGEGGQAVSIGDTFHEVDSHPIFLAVTDSDNPDHCRVIDPTLIDCNHATSGGLVAMIGNGHAVKGLRVINTGAAAYQRVAVFATGSTDCVVEIESADDGTVERVLNNGTNCRVVESRLGGAEYKDQAGARSGFRNALINGDFKMWQRGTTFDSATVPANNDDTYLADRWYLLSDGNDIVDVAREATTIPGGGFYAFKFDVETADKKFGIAQIIEIQDAKRFQSGPFTLSFKARKGGSNATAETLRAAVVEWDGAADSVTSDIVSAWGAAGANPTLIANAAYLSTPSNLTLTTSYQTFVITANSAGSFGNLIVFIWCDDADATVADLIYITDVQLERGIGASAFERRPLAIEQALCERYYQSHGTALHGRWSGADTCHLAMAFPVTMRVAPTLTLLDDTPTIGEFGVANRTGTASTIGTSIVSTRGVMLSLTGFSSATANNSAVGTVDGIVAFSAEL